MTDTTSTTLYEVLGVAQNASDEEIRAAWRRSAKTLHPDAPTGNQGLFRLASAAYEVLSDPARRAAYDAELNAPPTHPPQPDPEPVVEDQEWVVVDEPVVSSNYTESAPRDAHPHPRTRSGRALGAADRLLVAATPGWGPLGRVLLATWCLADLPVAYHHIATWLGPALAGAWYARPVDLAGALSLSLVFDALALAAARWGGRRWAVVAALAEVSWVLGAFGLAALAGWVWLRSRFKRA